jgi:tetraacyldisaccharide 4'-kinase
MPDDPLPHLLWYGRGAGARLARLALAPLELGYGTIASLRNSLYDRGILLSRPTILPAIGVGNLTVGGTGKTPVAAWLVQRLSGLGARPAIVMRGYGGDEPEVHRRLNPEVAVVVSSDRIAGIERAAGLGADCVVLDDAFQHRRAWRQADVVLVSADRWTGTTRLLPAGPWRESPRALRRASVVLVTRKAATADEAAAVAQQLRRSAPAVPFATARLELAELRQVDDGRPQPLLELAGRKVLAIAGVGDPEAFLRQLADAGARVRFSLFPDHHEYSAPEASQLAASADAGELVVCTLKDAVKLATLWPREGPPLWYVSQRVVIEEGAPIVESLLRALLDARHPQP